jgi:hypothetical protein
LINEVGELLSTKKKERGTEIVTNSDELKLNQEGDHSINEEHEFDTGFFVLHSTCRFSVSLHS